jgi:hypothetical protein
MWKHPKKQNSVSLGETFEQVAKEVNLNLKKALNFILLKYTLKYKVQKLGVKLPEHLVSFLEKCLDVNLNNRPESFNDIL